MTPVRNLLAISATWGFLVLSNAEASEELSHDIAAQPLAQALSEFAAQTGLQLVYVSEIAASRGYRRLVLVSAPAHLRRAVRAFRALGVDAIACPAPFKSERRRAEPPWWPAPYAIDVARDAIYDYLGWAYYWQHGWLSPPTSATPLTDR